ncbi:MAG: ParA family protein, partial [Candidatus Dormibacteria bacterium]
VLAAWKGGQGKSTLAAHIASLIDGVLIDLEPWGAATGWWAGRNASTLWQSPDGSAVLRALATGKAPRPRKGEAGRPRLVPSHEQLLQLGHGVSNGASATSAWAWTAEGQPALMVPTSDGPRPLAQALAVALPRWADEWSAPVVVDTPAGFSALGDGAIAAADVVVLPVTPDMWSVPALDKFMSAYRDSIPAGLVVPNRVRSRRVSDETWSDVLASPGVVSPPFVLGPPVMEAEVIHTASRPIHSGPIAGETREAVIQQIERVAAAALQLATSRARRHAI